MQGSTGEVTVLEAPLTFGGGWMICSLLQAGASGRAASLFLWSHVDEPVISCSRQAPLLGGVPTLPLASPRALLS